MVKLAALSAPPIFKVPAFVAALSSAEVLDKITPASKDNSPDFKSRIAPEVLSPPILMEEPDTSCKKPSFLSVVAALSAKAMVPVFCASTVIFALTLVP